MIANCHCNVCIFLIASAILTSIYLNHDINCDLLCQNWAYCLFQDIQKHRGFKYKVECFSMSKLQVQNFTRSILVSHLQDHPF